MKLFILAIICETAICASFTSFLFASKHQRVARRLIQSGSMLAVEDKHKSAGQLYTAAYLLLLFAMAMMNVALFSLW